jgi:ATP-dependent Lon protease
MVVLGHMSLGGYVVQVESLAETLQVAFDSGAKRILIPMIRVTVIPLCLVSYFPSSKYFLF